MFLLPLSHKIKFIVVISLLSFMDLKPVSNLRKPRTKRSGEKHMRIGTIEESFVTPLVIPDSDGKGCSYRHELAKNEAQIVDVGSADGRWGLVNFPKNASLSGNKFSNVDALNSPSTNFISNALSIPFTKVDAYPPKVSYKDVQTYLFVPKPVFPTDVSETEPYDPVYEPEEAPCPNKCLPFDEAFIKDSDEWILDFMSDPSFNTNR
ncbi:hypothetical protein AgCh_022874 [Apium graveolens]